MRANCSHPFESILLVLIQICRSLLYSMTITMAKTAKQFQQLAIEFTESLPANPPQFGLTEEQIEELYAKDPDEPWWNW